MRRVHQFRGLVLGVMLLGLLGCQNIETEYQDCPCYKPLDAVSQYVLDDACIPAEEVVETVEQDTAGLMNKVGSPCETDPEDPTNMAVDNSVCETGACFTRDTLAYQAGQLGAEWPYEIPGGMCSKFLCMADSECGETGFCFNVAPLFEAPIPIGLCLKRCNEYSDCRFDEGYVCYFTGVPDQRACLPDTIVVDIPCGDGICAESELGKGTCPRDCCGDGTCDDAETNELCPEDCP